MAMLDPDCHQSEAPHASQVERSQRLTNPLNRITLAKIAQHHLF